jgi:hypothetical protein
MCDWDVHLVNKDVLGFDRSFRPLEGRVMDEVYLLIIYKQDRIEEKKKANVWSNS